LASIRAGNGRCRHLAAAGAKKLIETYAHLTGDFYKKVDKQAASDGARTSMIDYLKEEACRERDAAASSRRR